MALWGNNHPHCQMRSTMVREKLWARVTLLPVAFHLVTVATTIHPAFLTVAMFCHSLAPFPALRKNYPLFCLPVEAVFTVGTGVSKPIQCVIGVFSSERRWLN